MPNPALARSGLAWKYYAKRLRRQSTVSFAYKLAVAICCDRQRIHASISISMSGDQSLLLSIVLLSSPTVALPGQLTHWSTARHNSIISVSAYVGRRCQIFSARLNDQRRQAAAPRHRLPVSTLAPVQSTCFCCFRSLVRGYCCYYYSVYCQPAYNVCVGWSHCRSSFDHWGQQIISLAPALWWSQCTTWFLFPLLQWQFDLFKFNYASISPIVDRWSSILDPQSLRR